MFNNLQFRELIIRPALVDMQLYSANAEELLVFTCATESNGGYYLKQIKGPAVGIYQMEPNSYYDIWNNYIIKNCPINLKLMSNFHIYFMPDVERMIYDMRFATLMARIFYLRITEPLPDMHKTDDIWSYYKRHYNTLQGKADKNESISKYHSFISS